MCTTCTMVHVTIGGRAFSSTAAQIWKSLSTAVQSSESLNICRRRLKTKLFERTYNWHRACQTTLLLRDSLSLSRSFLLWLQPWSLSTIMLLWHSFLIIITVTGTVVMQQKANKLQNRHAGSIHSEMMVKLCKWSLWLCALLLTTPALWQKAEYHVWGKIMKGYYQFVGMPLHVSLIEGSPRSKNQLWMCHAHNNNCHISIAS